MMNETGNFPGPGVALALHVLVPGPALLDLRECRRADLGDHGHPLAALHPAPVHPGRPVDPEVDPGLQADLARLLPRCPPGERALDGNCFARLRESAGGEVEIGGRVRRRHLRADARRAARNDGEREADGVDALGGELLGEARGGRPRRRSSRARSDARPGGCRTRARSCGRGSERCCRGGGRVARRSSGSGRARPGSPRRPAGRGCSRRDRAGRAGGAARRSRPAPRRSRRSRRRPPCRACR